MTEKKRINETKFTRHAFWGIVFGIAGGMFATWLWGTPLLITLGVAIPPVLASVGWEWYGTKGGAPFSWRDISIGTTAAWIVLALGWLSTLS